MLNQIVRIIFNKMGYEIIPKRWTEVTEAKQKGFDDEFMPIYEKCTPYTMTSVEKMHALYRAVEYLEVNKIEGSIVECGVAKGGSMMLVAAVLVSRQSTNRMLYLYDTFAGMPEPSRDDVNYRGDPALKQWKQGQHKHYNEWCYSPIDEVEDNLASTGYPESRLVYVKGKVQDTVPDTVPERIALLRLDTDWYDSTKHELEYLYPRLVNGGVLIIDDYGHWEGCRKAVTEYFDDSPFHPLLTRIDRLGVIAVKLGFDE